MDEAEPPRWTIAQHFAAGSIAIMQIATDRAHCARQPVCHHFYEVDPIDPRTVSMEATYRHAVPLFALAGVDFLPDRLEAWETIKPEEEWLQARIPAIVEAAERVGLVYRGWTWEPRDRQPIAAADFHIINNRTV